VLACAPALRPALGRLVRQAAPGVNVISYHEIGEHLQVEMIANIDSYTPNFTEREDNNNDRFASVS
jgi:flagellar biosynthesis component FlhA